MPNLISAYRIALLIMANFFFSPMTHRVGAQTEVMRTEGLTIVSRKSKDPKAGVQREEGIQDSNGNMVVPFGRYHFIEQAGNLFYVIKSRNANPLDVYEGKERFDGILTSKGKMIALQHDEVLMRYADLVVRSRKHRGAESRYEVEVLTTKLTPFPSEVAMPPMIHPLKLKAFGQQLNQIPDVTTYEDGQLISFNTDVSKANLLIAREGNRIVSVCTGWLFSGDHRYRLITPDGQWVCDRQLRILTRRFDQIALISANWLIGVDGEDTAYFIDANNEPRPCNYYIIADPSPGSYAQSYLLFLAAFKEKKEEVHHMRQGFLVRNAAQEETRVLKEFERFEFNAVNQTILAHGVGGSALFVFEDHQSLKRILADKSVATWTSDKLTGLLKTSNTPPFDIYNSGGNLLAERCDSIGKLNSSTVVWRSGQCALFEEGDFPLHFGAYSNFQVILPRSVYLVSRGREKAVMDNRGSILVNWSKSLSVVNSLPGIEIKSVEKATMPGEFVIWNSAADSSHFFKGTMKMFSVSGRLREVVKGQHDYYVSEHQSTRKARLVDGSGRSLSDRLDKIEKFQEGKHFFFLVTDGIETSMCSHSMQSLLPFQHADRSFWDRVVAIKSTYVEQAPKIEGQQIDCGDENFVFHNGVLTGRSGHNYTSDLIRRKIIKSANELEEVSCWRNDMMVHVQCQKCMGRGTVDTYRTAAVVVSQRRSLSNHFPGVIETVEFRKERAWTFQCDHCHGSKKAWHSLKELIRP